MAGPESDREQLSSDPLVLTCPSCHEDTTTGYTLWEEAVLRENPGIKQMDFTCEHCKAHVLYDPVTQDLSLD